MTRYYKYGAAEGRADKPAHRGAFPFSRRRPLLGKSRTAERGPLHGQ